MRDRLNQLRDLIGHYQVGKMVYSVNIHQAVFVKTVLHLRWLNIVFAHTLANAIQHAHKYCIIQVQSHLKFSKI